MIGFLFFLGLGVVLELLVFAGVFRQSHVDLAVAVFAGVWAFVCLAEGSLLWAVLTGGIAALSMADYKKSVVKEKAKRREQDAKQADDSSNDKGLGA